MAVADGDFPLDVQRSWEILRFCAENGRIESMAFLGLVLSHPEKVPEYRIIVLAEGTLKERREEGFKWRLKAANAGDFKSMHNVGCSYGNGDGIAQSWPLAKKWFMRSSAHGDLASVETLRRMHRSGFDTTQADVDEAARTCDTALEGLEKTNRAVREKLRKDVKSR